jgi:hypothetical protein
MKHTALLNSAVLLLGLIVGPGSADAEPPAAKPVTIVAFGDSTTAVRGPTKTYPAILQEELRHVRVINAGRMCCHINRRLRSSNSASTTQQ